MREPGRRGRLAPALPPAAGALALVLALVVGAIVVRASADPQPTATPGADRARPLAAFIGDSYTYGAATELAGTGFPSLLGELRGWDAENLGVNGTGYVRAPAYAERIDVAARLAPDIVVISGGRNDLLPAGGADSDAELDAAVRELFRGLRSALPDARIIATSPLWDATPTPAALVRLRAVVEREVLAIGGEHVDLGDLFAGRHDLIADDGLHPDARGLALLARRIHALLGP